MRDIPVFTTATGVASLFLKNIPFTNCAYIKIQDTQQPEQFLDECCDFCRCAGATEILASGHATLEKYPVHSSILEMSAKIADLPDTDAVLISVEKETMESWRSIYNEKMRNVPTAAHISYVAASRYLEKKSCYFVYRDGAMLGIGVACNSRIDALAATVPGAGQDVLIALCGILEGEYVHLAVADNNAPAVRLYERLGFAIDGIESKWYKII